MAESSIEVQISFEEGGRENLLVTPLGANLYRLEETPVFGEFNYLDIIEAVPSEDGVLKFGAVRQPTPLRRFDYLLSKELIESAQMEALLNRVLVAGGNWEKVMGGLLYLYLPPSSEIDPAKEIDQIARELPKS